MSTDIFNLGGSRTTNPFGINPSIDIRGGIQEFINRHPNPMVYVRLDEKFPSVGSDPTNGSPDLDDQTTFGMGAKVQFERHLTRRVINAGSTQDLLNTFGYLTKYKTIIYVPRYYYPKNRDLYLEVEWDVDWQEVEDKGKPTRLVNAYQVNEAVSFREDEVSYVACGCNIFNFEQVKLNEWIKALSNVWIPKIVI